MMTCRYEHSCLGWIGEKHPPSFEPLFVGNFVDGPSPFTCTRSLSHRRYLCALPIAQERCTSLEHEVAVLKEELDAKDGAA